MKIPIRFSDGVQKMAHVLVDTGAEISLIHPGFLPQGSPLDTPQKELRLLVANRQPLRGGDKACSVNLCFFKEHPDPALTYKDTHIDVPMYTYTADIQYDIFIGNPWLFDNLIAPFAQRGTLC